MRSLKAGLVLTAAAAFIAATPFTASADLIISEVVDATLPGGLPKYVELTNTGNSPVDLSLYSINNYNNGSPTSNFGSTRLTGILDPCESYVISYESNDAPGVGLFFDTYGFDPDFFDLGAFINGDDVIILFLGDDDGSATGTIVDVYGVLGVDGSGEPWEYTDGYARRNSNVGSANAVFTLAEWTFSGANGLETGDDLTELPLILAETNPGQHLLDDCSPVPVENTTWGSIKQIID